MHTTSGTVSAKSLWDLNRTKERRKERMLSNHLKNCLKTFVIAPAFSGDMLGGGATSATEPGVAAAVEGLVPSSFAPGGLLQVTPRERDG